MCRNSTRPPRSVSASVRPRLSPARPPPSGAVRPAPRRAAGTVSCFAAASSAPLGRSAAVTVYPPASVVDLIGASTGLATRGRARASARLYLAIISASSKTRSSSPPTAPSRRSGCCAKTRVALRRSSSAWRPTHLTTQRTSCSASAIAADLDASTPPSLYCVRSGSSARCRSGAGRPSTTSGGCAIVGRGGAACLESSSGGGGGSGTAGAGGGSRA